jgi:hypothetical protein
VTSAGMHQRTNTTGAPSPSKCTATSHARRKRTLEKEVGIPKMEGTAPVLLVATVTTSTAIHMQILLRDALQLALFGSASQQETGSLLGPHLVDNDDKAERAHAAMRRMRRIVETYKLSSRCRYNIGTNRTGPGTPRSWSKSKEFGVPPLYYTVLGCPH